MPVLSEVQRHEKIVNYISLHQGCLKEEAYDALKDVLSRNSFFKDLPNLIKEGKITMKPKNKRDTMLFVDRENPLIYVPKQLEDFENAYAQFLDATIKRVKEKDFSEIAQLLGIQSSDPAKWSVDDSCKFMDYECKMCTEYFLYYDKIMEETRSTLEETTRLIHGIKLRVGAGREPTEKQKRAYVGTLSILKSMKFEDEQLEYPQIRAFEISLMLRNAIDIYFALFNTVIDLSIFVWPKLIQNGSGLKKLYSYTYSKIAEIQFKLSSFLSSIKSYPIYIFDDPTEFLIDERSTTAKRTNLLNCVKQHYRALNMRSEIEMVINSISRIGAPLLKFGRRTGTDDFEVWMHEREKERKNLIKLMEQGLVTHKESPEKH